MTEHVYIRSISTPEFAPARLLGTTVQSLHALPVPTQDSNHSHMHILGQKNSNCLWVRM